jgi:hypothetical protein
MWYLLVHKKLHVMFIADINSWYQILLVLDTKWQEIGLFGW